MIHLNLSGGLGNQLFEYSFAREIQIQTGQSIELNTYELDNYETNRHYALDNYQLADNAIHASKELPWFVHRRSIVGAISRKISPGILLKYSKKHNSLIWYETSYTYVPQFNSGKDIYLGGYWQSEKYFPSVSETIRSEIRLKKPLSQEAGDYETKIKQSNSVCLHIRKDDYVGTDYEVCTLEYYKSAMGLIENQISNPTYYVFSDDPLWVQNHVTFNSNMIFVNGNSEQEDLYLMSSCKHFIMSNSSFSWWAQELSDNKEKIVIAPSRWHKTWNINDIYKEGWTIIDTK